jgi:hypothetical protein
MFGMSINRACSKLKHDVIIHNIMNVFVLLRARYSHEPAAALVGSHQKQSSIVAPASVLARLATENYFTIFICPSAQGRSD